MTWRESDVDSNSMECSEEEERRESECLAVLRGKKKCGGPKRNKNMLSIESESEGREDRGTQPKVELMVRSEKGGCEEDGSN